MIDDIFKYQIVRGLISPDTAHILSARMAFEVEDKNVVEGKGFPSAEHENTLNFSTSPDLQILHTLLTSKVEEVTGNTKLYPTYYYARTYFKGADMFSHKDRPACQNSLTLNLGQSHNYPFYIEKKNGEYEEINMQPGDAVIYRGCEWNHYRPVFEGDWYTQVFLHWVDDSPENYELRYENLGGPDAINTIQHETDTNWNDLLKGK
jgi:hypothetical protein